MEKNIINGATPNPGQEASRPDAGEASPAKGDPLRDNVSAQGEHPSIQPGLDEYLDDFMLEFMEAIKSINAGLNALEKDETDLRALEEVYRNAHNMKGGSNALGFPILGGFFALMEATIEPPRKRGKPFTKRALKALRSAASLLEISADIVKAAKSDATLDVKSAEIALRAALDPVEPEVN